MIKNKIEFSNLNKDFIIELREKVKKHFESEKISKYGNINLHLQSLFMIAMYTIPYVLMLSGIVSSVPLVMMCWGLMGLGMAGLGMVLMHDANHGSYSKNLKVNSWMSKSLYILGGFPPNWQHQHNTLHHGFTNIDGYDEDIQPAGILRFSPHQPLHKIHRFQYIYAWFLYGLMTLSWVTMKDFTRLNKYRQMDVPLRNNKNYNRLFTELIFSKILYYLSFLILPLILVPVSWYWIVMGFIFMHFISGFILSVIFQTAHVVPESSYPLPDKNGTIDYNWAILQLQTTSDYSPNSPIFSWFIGGLNYQVEHHLFPNISHVHYKDISSIVKDTAIKYDLPYHVNSNFIMALRKHKKMLKQLGR